RPAKNVLAEDRAEGLTAPQAVEPLRRAFRVGGDEGAVHRADGGADDEVGPHPGVGQRAQHADLVRAEQPTAAEYECSRHLPQATRATPTITCPISSGTERISPVSGCQSRATTTPGGTRGSGPKKPTISSAAWLYAWATPSQYALR